MLQLHTYIYFLGLEAKSLLSQWYPHKGLYPGRDVEGMYLLQRVPGLERGDDLKPKELIKGCKEVLETLQRKLQLHYGPNSRGFDVWKSWFETIIPDVEDVNEYAKYQIYYCPLLSIFDKIYENDPTKFWKPSLPICLFSIFPSHVIVAMPSLQSKLDYNNSNTVNEHNATVKFRYLSYMNSELNRLKNLKAKRLREILSRHVKLYGAKYPFKLNITDLSSTIFSINSTFISLR